MQFSFKCQCKDPPYRMCVRNAAREVREMTQKMIKTLEKPNFSSDQVYANTGANSHSAGDG